MRRSFSVALAVLTLSIAVPSATQAATSVQNSVQGVLSVGHRYLL